MMCLYKTAVLLILLLFSDRPRSVCSSVDAQTIELLVLPAWYQFPQLGGCWFSFRSEKPKPCGDTIVIIISLNSLGKRKVHNNP